MKSLKNRNKLFGINDVLDDCKNPLSLENKIGLVPAVFFSKSFENDNNILRSLVFDNNGDVRDITALELSPSADDIVKKIHNELIKELPEETPMASDPFELLDTDLIRPRSSQYGDEVTEYRDLVKGYVDETVAIYKRNREKKLTESDNSNN